MKYANMEDFAGKMDWEGGLFDFVIGYGVSKDDLPDDMPDDVRAEVEALIDKRFVLQDLQARIFDLGGL